MQARTHEASAENIGLYPTLSVPLSPCSSSFLRHPNSVTKEPWMRIVYVSLFQCKASAVLTSLKKKVLLMRKLKIAPI